ncbi:MAG: multiprotein-bridging factor 1 family protein [Candidatus Aenigmatarchaeota archaeon]
MECELCGKDTELIKAKIEGAVVSVCKKCSKLGEVIIEAKPIKIKEKPKVMIEETTIDPKFAQIIKNARESMKLTREDLAKKINEKVSVIENIEHGMRPTDNTARKLENALRIKLLGYEVKNIKMTTTKTEELTLGDIATIKTNKK